MAVELVLDASVSLAWFLKETPQLVPLQWGIEVGHVLLREHRRKILKRAKLQQALDDLESFDIRIHLEAVTARRVVELAGRYQLQGYDALYFDLAKILSLPLATLDDGHRQAAKQHGVTLFPGA